MDIYYIEGRVAAAEGQSALSCPYLDDETGERFEAWTAGYMEARYPRAELKPVAARRAILQCLAKSVREAQVDHSPQ